jgi:hypothetical protein
MVRIVPFPWVEIFPRPLMAAAVAGGAIRPMEETEGLVVGAIAVVQEEQRRKEWFLVKMVER